MMVTAESLEQEQLELRVKVRLLRMHDACPSAPDAQARVSAGGKDHSHARVCGFGPSYMTSRRLAPRTAARNHSAPHGPIRFM